jgi:tRNA 2-selenouridine synthase
MKLHFEKDLPIIEDLQKLFINNTPMIDVRAAVEFKQGAFNLAENLPLMNDEERHQVGIKYKNKGQDEAINLAAEMITAEMRLQRIEAWKTFIKQHPEGVLYCFRGGMRSKISQQWIYEETGIKYPRVQGGYKAMRRFLIDNSERLIEQTSFILLGGSTGSGKTRLLEHIPNSIDLEGLANHRGSAFGGNATPQPTQINFENTLAVKQLKLEQENHKHIILEDEGRTIGGVHLPIILYEKMATSPIVMLKVNTEDRLQTSMQEYAIDMLEDFQQTYGEEHAFLHFRNALLTSLDKIQKRLGGERHKKLRQLAESALDEHEKTGSTEAHIPWVSSLLIDYYDPMYNYQIENKKDRIVFTGDQQEVNEYLLSLSN